MPSEPAISGRCYCGSVTLSATRLPDLVAYCHCQDCTRWTGAPAPAFAGFARHDLTLPARLSPVSPAPGVDRRFCLSGGSALAAAVASLPDQFDVPPGILDQAAGPGLVRHCHARHELPGLPLDDGSERVTGSYHSALHPNLRDET